MHLNTDLTGGVFLLAQNQTLPPGDGSLVIQSNFVQIAWLLASDASFKCLPYQLVGWLNANQGVHG